MGKKKKYYVVWNGVTPGIYGTWSECQAQIKGYPNAKYKSFSTESEAQKAFTDAPADHYRTGGAKQSKRVIKHQAPKELVHDTIAVDAACSGNPGAMEYRGVWTETGEEIFKQGPFKMGTNNIGEFLAIVHALAMLQRDGDTTSIWTDSRTAMAWVRNKKVKTTLKRTSDNTVLFDMIERALQWLEKNSYSNEILKWKTEQWGEIPADFGRK